MYHRLFKDSKIKKVKENEFVEYLKLKQSHKINEILSAKFITHDKDVQRDSRLGSNISIKNYKSR